MYKQSRLSLTREGSPETNLVSQTPEKEYATEEVFELHICNSSFWPLSYILFHNNNKAFECSQKKRKKKMNGFGGLACMHHEPNFKLVPCDFLDLQVAILYLPSGSLLMHGLVLTKVLSTF